MKKGLVVGLAVAMFLAFLLPTVVWAQKMPSLPKGARLIQPTALYKVDEGGNRTRVNMPAAPSAVAPSNDGVITEPYIFAYIVPGTVGARLGVGAYASFPITGFDVWADGQWVGAAVTTFFSGTIPSLVPGDTGISQDLGFLTPEILRVGTHEVEVPVYPDYPRSQVHFLGKFTVEVRWFEVSVWGCLETLGPNEIVRLSFYISPIGEMPSMVSISTFAFSFNAHVENGVATLLFTSGSYSRDMGGQELDTTITEVGGAERSSTQVLWYPSLDELSVCGGKG